MAPSQAPSEFDESPDPDLLHQLELSRDRGFLGPGPVVEHVRHAQAFVEALGPEFGGLAVDLGSGGGLPGLVLARALPAATWLLVDASLRRIRFLEQAVRRLGLAGSVEARHVRAEELGRDPAWRGSCDAVVARSFGRPAVVAECASPLLRPGGRLLVSEPPGPVADAQRWPVADLAALSLEPVSVAEVGTRRLAEFRQVSLAADRFPRRVGVPDRQPLF